MPLLHLAVVLVLTGAACIAGATELVVTPRMHHLRWGTAREWDDFAERAEAAILKLGFDAKANAAEQTLRVRHRDLKRNWVVRLNGREVAKLPTDENPMVTHWPLPAGALVDGANSLEVLSPGNPPAPGAARPGTTSDDVHVGEIAVLARPRAEVLSEASLELKVVEARDAGKLAPVPCRITITDAKGALMELGVASDQHHAVRPGVVYSATGEARITLPAGRYTVYAGRGFEYSLGRMEVDLRPGERPRREMSIRRVVPTDGYVACDTHVHTWTYSRHGDATLAERMATLAGEGIELPIATDHNIQVDYEQAALDAGVRQFFTPVIGNEVTTATLGHFNVFPIAKEAKLINWRVRESEAIGREVRAIAPDAVIILNHARDIHGGFRPFDPSRHIALTGESLDDWQNPATAMEIVNSGATQTDPMRLVHDWMGMLNRGHALTPVGASDSHDVNRYIVGQGRTYIRCKDDAAGAIDVAAAVEAFRSGRVLVSYGLLADIQVAGKFESGDLAPAGELGEKIEVKVRVLGPEWTKATEVMLFANGLLVQKAGIGRPANEPEPAGVKWEKTWTLPRPAHDVQLVAVATGPGIDAPYWPTAKPYQPTSAAPKTLVFGVSGAVRLDADGSGAFDSALAYATRAAELHRDDIPALLTAVARYDAAVASHAAGILRRRLGEAYDNSITSPIKHAAEPIQRGFAEYQKAWEQTLAARAGQAAPPRPQP